MQFLIDLHFFLQIILELTLHKQSLSPAKHNFANITTKTNLTL